MPENVAQSRGTIYYVVQYNIIELMIETLSYLCMYMKLYIFHQTGTLI